MLFMCQNAQLKISLKYNNQIRKLEKWCQDDRSVNQDQFCEINLAVNQKSIATHIKKNKSQMTCPGESNTKNQSTSATMPRMCDGAPGELFLRWARPIIITVSLNVMLDLLEMGKLSPGHSKFRFTCLLELRAGPSYKLILHLLPRLQDNRLLGAQILVPRLIFARCHFQHRVLLDSFRHPFPPFHIWIQT